MEVSSLFNYKACISQLGKSVMLSLPSGDFPGHVELEAGTPVDPAQQVLYVDGKMAFLLSPVLNAHRRSLTPQTQGQPAQVASSSTNT